MKPVLVHFVGAVMLWTTVTLQAADTSPPNVIVILADDMGLGDYSAYGTKDLRTPAIDRLCREGMTFENFRANSPVCSPTRAALLTGCYPDRVGVPGVIRHTPDNSWGCLSPQAILLPQILKPKGYHSAIIGKWHLGLTSPDTPTERGFDFFHGFLGDMMDDYVTHRRGGQNFMRRDREIIDPAGHATDLFTDWACDYLNRRAKANLEPGKLMQPFFLYVAYNAPHDPIQPSPEWLKKVQDREPEMHAKRAGLVALIEQMDAGIGKILEALDQSKLAENTLVIFTSDNGGVLNNKATNGPWRSEKQHMYDGGLRVPAVARWPGRIAANQRTQINGVTMDLFATIADAAGAELPANVDGISLLPILVGKPDTNSTAKLVNRELYFVRREGGPAYGGKTIEALIQGDWKLIQNSPFEPLELYNLKMDPKETQNLASEQKQVFKEMSASLRKQIQIGGQVAWQKPEQ